MHASQLLDAWETGEDRRPIERALLLLALDDPARSSEELASVDVAERDLKILRLRERMLGSHLECYCECPACGERLECGFDTRDLPSAPPREPMEVDGIRFRLPNSFDLSAVVDARDPAAARLRLAELCVVGASVPLSEDTVAKMSSLMAQAAGVADVLLALTCPSCGNQWRAVLDVGSFFWVELRSIARRLTEQVDLLARAYGWTEEAVLGLSPRRQKRYVELALA